MGPPDENRESADAGCPAAWGLWLAVTLGWWIFAFFPVHARTPDWVLRTQYVCFGSMPNGLPSAEGWMMLVAAPLLLALSLALVYPRGSRRLLRSWSARLIALIATAGLAAWVTPRIRSAEARPFLAGLLSERGGSEGLPEGYPKIRQKLPPFRLVDHRGKLTLPEDLGGRVTLLTFVYAHCATVCPRLSTQAKEALERIHDPRFQAVLISLDPWRDTPSSLPSLVRQWDLENERLRFLSGEPDEVQRFFRKLGVVGERDERNGEITHAPLVAVVDRSGSIRYWFNGAPTRWILDASSELLR